MKTTMLPLTEQPDPLLITPALRASHKLACKKIRAEK